MEQNLIAFDWEKYQSGKYEVVCREKKYKLVAITKIDHPTDEHREWAYCGAVIGGDSILSFLWLANGRAGLFPHVDLFLKKKSVIKYGAIYKDAEGKLFVEPKLLDNETAFDHRHSFFGTFVKTFSVEVEE